MSAGCCTAAALRSGSPKEKAHGKYWPEVAPDEHVWGYIKGVDLKNMAFKGPEEPKERLLEVLEDFKSRRNLVREFFQDKNVGFLIFNAGGVETKASKSYSCAKGPRAVFFALLAP